MLSRFSRQGMEVAWALVILATGSGCGGKGGEPLVVSTPVLDDDAPGTDTANTETQDSGDVAGGSGAPADSDFWYAATISGGDAANPAEYFDGDEVRVEAGSVRLTEGAADFMLELRYSGTVDGVPYQADCQVPIEWTGGLPATAADDPSGDGPVGCASIVVGTAAYAIDPEGLTIIETNDGSVLSGEFSLIAQAASGAVLQANGRVHAVLCDTFWSGAPCTYG